ncbi:DUF3011 domain-containing protein [Ottowia testudinis]|uniref:DUF3011 domain-containing protein n=1 Tax=Ottowia testudinis TaxID=2816950 RepID=A0A975CJU6_9BURK|nr:DUF3011 domain-containing protein [Ottowia testudinis]QTD47151.1 DUF3011 domain-containing protein [Ottowia testudinis]
MTAFRIAAPVAAALLALAPLAQAQYDRPIGQPLGGQPYGGQPYGQYGGTWGAPAGGTYASQGVTCESQDGAFRECRTPFGGAPAIARTLSNAPCVPGQTWGSRGPGTVWVNGGCRAEFVDAYGAGGDLGHGYGQPAPGAYGDSPVVRCESDQGRHRECRLPVRAPLTLVRQISGAACVEGQTWGSHRNGRVWVRGGCRGDFAPVAQGWGGAAPGWGQPWGGQTVTCESFERRANQCAWDGLWGRPRVVEQLSQNACHEGRSWGYDGRQIWVDRGCRARFGN